MQGTIEEAAEAAEKMKSFADCAGDPMADNFLNRKIATLEQLFCERTG